MRLTVPGRWGLFHHRLPLFLLGKRFFLALTALGEKKCRAVSARPENAGAVSSNEEGQAAVRACQDQEQRAHPPQTGIYGGTTRGLSFGS